MHLSQEELDDAKQRGIVHRQERNRGEQFGTVPRIDRSLSLTGDDYPLEVS